MCWLANQGGRVTLAVLGGLALLVAGCGEEGERPGTRPGARRPGPKVEPDEGKKTSVGQNLFLEVLPHGRRVLISAEVCLREGGLEQLLTRKGTKEHEAILAAEIDARQLHQALLLAGAQEGSPVRFTPKYRPASGTPIKVSLIYQHKGKKVTVPARSWIRNVKTGKELDSDWVFAGSMLVDNPLDAKAAKIYLANDGDVICISNIETALLDLPIESPKADAERGFEAWTDRIPEVGTKVVVVLEPVLPAKKPR
jgi:hypothetical protein